MTSSACAPDIRLVALRGVPMVQPGDDIAALILAAAAENGLEFRDGDILAVCQKIVSKAENRLVRLAEVAPSPRALEMAEATGKEPAIVELILRESRSVIRTRPGLIITEHRSGHILANAGVDRSNLTPEAEEVALLLPKDADASAKAIRQALEGRTGRRLGVVVTDSAGRPWRNGTLGLALGVAGPPAFRDLRGGEDLFGRKLEATMPAIADAVAAAAVLIMGETTEATPVALLRGLDWTPSEQTGASAQRPIQEDLFR